MDRALPAEEILQDDDREEWLLSMVGMAKERRLNADVPPDALVSLNIESVILCRWRAERAKAH